MRLCNDAERSPPCWELKDCFCATHRLQSPYWYCLFSIHLLLQTVYFQSALSCLQVNRIFGRMFMVRITRSHSCDRKWAMCQCLHDKVTIYFYRSSNQAEQWVCVCATQNMIMKDFSHCGSHKCSVTCVAAHYPLLKDELMQRSYLIYIIIT